MKKLFAILLVALLGVGILSVTPNAIAAGNDGQTQSKQQAQKKNTEPTQQKKTPEKQSTSVDLTIDANSLTNLNYSA